MTAVAATEVVRTFAGVTAVGNVSLSVDHGEVVGLVGANGAGKTTLLRLLLGLLPPDAGRVELAGGPPDRARRRHVGYLPQSMGLWPELSLLDHLRLVRDVYDVGSPTIDDPILGAVAKQPVGTLPLGLRRRAAFVVALAHAPDVLLLDEPTSGVDPLARSRLWNTIRESAGAGAGVLVSTHYLDEAARCDRVVLLADGRVVADGTVASLTRGRTTVRIRADGWQRAWQRLEDAGLAVLPAGRDLRVVDSDAGHVRAVLADVPAHVDLIPATLDEVFLAVSRR